MLPSLECTLQSTTGESGHNRWCPDSSVNILFNHRVTCWWSLYIWLLGEGVLLTATMKCLVVAVALLAFAYAADIKECSPTADDPGCSDDECCIPEQEFFKVSKRDDILPIEELKPIFPWGNREGRCVQYKQEGENCYSMASWQECGCADGLRCHYTPAPSELKSPELKRAIPPWLRPKGVHACVVDTPAQ
ncbi:hypothetical protein EB796_015179 [Bugula neritina]|uniref:Uncharacterized protein n=1 Tax=Bugula neritina TaxID=10212 RepID=A0A7J7JM55_BUGNE|nr:hypothetical protein EB796_015179 [Bugula neritina]